MGKKWYKLMGKIVAVASSGGHLDQLLYFLKELEIGNEIVVATFRKPDAEARIANYQKYWLKFPTNRNFINNAKNLIIAFRIQWRHHPTGYLSTGAASAVIFGLVAKIHRVPFLYVEPIDRILLPTLTAKLLSKMGIPIQIYWETQLELYENRRY
jgi:UDP-N-acetylglucosamine:LPS N-acetylglucosamine transferase